MVEISVQPWADDPIAHPDDDALKRRPYALGIAQTVQSQSRTDSSSVFGLVGSWGSGKTSLLNLVVSELDNLDKTWQVTRFTPWATGDVSSLVQEFYASIAKVVPAKNGSKEKLKALAQIAAPATALIPGVGNVLEASSQHILSRVFPDESWSDLFEKVSAELSQTSQKVLVVVDDIDRLQRDELFTLLKVVRLLGRFPGVQYLLAYDASTLEETLRGGSERLGGFTASRFMEKIVQHPFIVPPFAAADRRRLMSDELVRIVGPRGSIVERDPRLSRAFEVVCGAMDTPRAMGRYAAALEQVLALHHVAEIDDLDLMVLTAIRLSYPRAYELTLRRRASYTTNQKDDEIVKGLVEEIEKTVGSDDFWTVRRLMLTLFPDALSTRSSYSWQPAYNGISNSEYFDRYFQMGVPFGDTSDIEVLACLEAAAEGDADALSKIVGQPNNVSFNVAISKVVRLQDQIELDPARRVALAKSLARAFDLASRARMVADTSVPEKELLHSIANSLGILGDAVPFEGLNEVFRLFSDNDDAIELWYLLDLQVREQRTDELPGWLDEVTDQVRARAEISILDRLKNFDNLRTDAGITTGVYFLKNTGGFQDLSSMLLQGIAQQDFTVIHIAALLVQTKLTFRNGTGSTYELSEQRFGDTLSELLPDTDFSWLDGDPVKVAVDDLTWGNRAKFVIGRRLHGGGF
ncbi:KAP family NTPase [Nesterenkonia sp. LB17]|uniref:P-loop NTPase fold protein n=1 Tax=Nesterenkonia sp. LB17 TaxID=2901230 RepID=UPI001F4CDD32|nr:P-loop NTPase fold protein [Nesterenkonia sp. LB17]MCH8565685.1 KAP family NTPase [Nesterenkonia sp. LB17]